VNATAIIPIKRFARAKTRLLDAVDARGRAALLRAMLADVLAAVDRCDSIEYVIVVTGERRAERIALAHAQRMRCRLEVLRDPDDAGQPHAATLGIVRAKALGARCVALLPGDCPLLDPAELDGALERMRPGRVAVVPDRGGSGTNALLMSPPDAIAPGFGPGSRARHTEWAERRGLEVAVEKLGSLALDLDTPADLADLVAALTDESERAPATARELSGLGLLAGRAR
jgi:2-phospho-L-lactate/phosphoenolpyruvate guanylyltransferase